MSIIGSVTRHCQVSFGISVVIFAPDAALNFAATSSAAATTAADAAADPAATAAATTAAAILQTPRRVSQEWGDKGVEEKREPAEEKSRDDKTQDLRRPFCATRP